jgi:hypothetical protein
MEFARGERSRWRIRRLRRWQFFMDPLIYEQTLRAECYDRRSAEPEESAALRSDEDPEDRRSALNHQFDFNGGTIFVADAHRDDGKRFVVRADEKLTASLEL